MRILRLLVEFHIRRRRAAVHSDFTFLIFPLCKVRSESNKPRGRWQTARDSDIYWHYALNQGDCCVPKVYNLTNVWHNL